MEKSGFWRPSFCVFSCVGVLAVLESQHLRVGKAGDRQRKRASVQKSERLEENVEFFPKICIIWEDNA